MSTATLPRVRVLPELTDREEGTLAAELSADAGLYLDLWQINATRDFLALNGDVPAARECCLICSRQNGKGAVIEAIELYYIFVLGKQCILHTAHEMKTAAQAFKRMESYLNSSPELRGLVKDTHRGNGKEGFTFRNGSTLNYIARTKGSGRGFTADLIIVDEAYAYTEDMHAALFPTISARPNAQIMYFSSPPLDGNSGDNLWKLKKRSESSNPGRLCFIDFGAARPKKTDDMSDAEVQLVFSQMIDDPEVWAQTNPAVATGRLTLDVIRDERFSFADDTFLRERLGVWPEQADSVRPIDMDEWRKLMDREAKIQIEYVGAIDVAPGNKFTALAACGDQTESLVYMDADDSNSLYDENMNRRVVRVLAHINGTASLVDTVRTYHSQRRARTWVVVANSPAGAFIPALQESGIPITVVNDQAAAQAAGALAGAVEAGSLRHNGDRELDRAVEYAARKDVGDGGWVWSRTRSDIDISPLYAATLAHQGWTGSRNMSPIDNIH